MRSAVVLPHPDGPTKIMNSPSTISSESRSTASVPSTKRFVTWSSSIDAISPRPGPEQPGPSSRRSLHCLSCRHPRRGLEKLHENAVGITQVEPVPPRVDPGVDRDRRAHELDPRLTQPPVQRGQVVSQEAEVRDAHVP